MNIGKSGGSSQDGNKKNRPKAGMISMIALAVVKKYDGHVVDLDRCSFPDAFSLMQIL